MQFNSEVKIQNLKRMQDFMKILLKEVFISLQNPWGIKIWQSQTSEQLKKGKPKKDDDRIGIKE